MYCQSCGSTNQEGARFCVNCGNDLTQAPAEQAESGYEPTAANDGVAMAQQTSPDQEQPQYGAAGYQSPPNQGQHQYSAPGYQAPPNQGQSQYGAPGYQAPPNQGQPQYSAPGYQAPPNQGQSQYGAPGYQTPPNQGYNYQNQGYQNQGYQGPQSQYRPGTYEHDVEQNKVFAILAYFIFFIPLLASQHSRFARYHANQGLTLLIFSVGLGVFQSIVHVVLGFSFYWAVSSIFGLAGLAMLALFIMGIINAARGHMKPVPVLGALFTIIK